MWFEVLYWIDHVWSSIECVCYTCGPRDRLDAPSHMFCMCLCMSELSPHFGV